MLLTRAVAERALRAIGSNRRLQEADPLDHAAEGERGA